MTPQSDVAAVWMLVLLTKVVAIRRETGSRHSRWGGTQSSFGGVLGSRYHDMSISGCKQPVGYTGWELQVC